MRTITEQKHACQSCGVGKTGAVPLTLRFDAILNYLNKKGSCNSVNGLASPEYICQTEGPHPAYALYSDRSALPRCGNAPSVLDFEVSHPQLKYLGGGKSHNGLMNKH